MQADLFFPPVESDSDTLLDFYYYMVSKIIPQNPTMAFVLYIILIHF